MPKEDVQKNIAFLRLDKNWPTLGTGDYLYPGWVKRNHIYLKGWVKKI